MRLFGLYYCRYLACTIVDIWVVLLSVFGLYYCRYLVCTIVSTWVVLITKGTFLVIVLQVHDKGETVESLCKKRTIMELRKSLVSIVSIHHIDEL